MRSVHCRSVLESAERMTTSSLRTTDFLCTMQDGSLRVRECVSRDHLMKPMNVKLLDASRGYWQKNGVTDWKIVTDAEKEA